jgi:hypothetical protein
VPSRFKVSSTQNTVCNMLYQLGMLTVHLRGRQTTPSLVSTKKPIFIVDSEDEIPGSEEEVEGLLADIED